MASLRYCNTCKSDKSTELFTKCGHECSECKKKRREKERERFYTNRKRCACGSFLSDGYSKEKHENTKGHQNYLKYGYKGGSKSIDYLINTNQYEKFVKCERSINYANYTRDKEKDKS